ncbi:phosphate signaling complex protein PhoU [Oscillospiraceae bacterium MB08-C2-2]|nr:phosphate signaling complex protein PhoU [Oscillospiraceae bacterium MB08-C2-2]
MRSKFDSQLEKLHTELMSMGAMCETAIACAIKALLSGDTDLVEKAISIDASIDDMEREIETLCMKLLLQQQPVARDLRKISSALKMITDMERIGDQAADIAEIVSMDNIHASDETFSINDMAKAVIKMVSESVDAYVRQDLELVRQVIAYDDVVDRCFNEVKAEIIDLIGKDPSKGEYALDLLMIAKYFERIGDHATNIAEWVEFSITGRHGGKE